MTRRKLFLSVLSVKVKVAILKLYFLIHLWSKWKIMCPSEKELHLLFCGWRDLNVYNSCCVLINGYDLVVFDHQANEIIAVVVVSNSKTTTELCYISSTNHQFMTTWLSITTVLFRLRSVLWRKFITKFSSKIISKF